MPAISRTHFLPRAVQEARSSVVGLRSRSIVAMTGLTVAVALFLAVQSLVVTVRFQVADSFDAYASTTVHALLDPLEPGAPQEISADVETRVEALQGVLGSSRYTDLSGSAPPVSTSRTPGSGLPGQIPMYLAEDDFLATLEAEVSGSSLADAGAGLPVAMIGREIATSIGLLPGEVGTRVLLVGDSPVTIVGVIESSPRLSVLRRAIVLPLDAPLAMGGRASPLSLIVTTAPGAAGSVADALPGAAMPYDQRALKVSEVGTGAPLREDVDHLLVQLGWGISASAGLVGALVIAAHASGSVSLRIGEIGLRRSLGARRRDIVAQFLSESILIGATAGAAGAVLGVGAVIVASLLQSWVPVIAPLALVLAPVCAVVVSAGAGAIPALRASRIDPAVALRR